MQCRLCFLELESFVLIFKEESKNNNNEVADIINKCLQIELKFDDPISTKICDSCWQQLRDFNQFRLMVSERQQTFVLKNETESVPDANSTSAWLVPEMHLMDLPKVAELLVEEENDVKDAILDEPEIDAAFHSQHEADDDDFDASAGSSEIGDKLIAEQHDKVAELEAVCRNAFQMQTTTKKCRIRLSKKSVMSKPVGRPRKGKEKVVVAKLATTQRTLRTRTNASKLVTATMRRSQTPAEIKSESDSSNLETMQRDRPKDAKSKEKLRNSPTQETLEQREKSRSIVREMDEFIAANVKLDCCLCGEPLKDFKTLKDHFRLQHKCTGYVRCCNNRYNKRSIYVDHLHLHRDPEYFRCKLCCKNYLNRNSYDMHILRFHTDKQQLTYECDVCGKRFAKTYLLTMHKKNHKGNERKEICEFCNKAFRTPFELKAHVKRMHDEAFEPVICDICGANFRNQANFLVHKQTVHREGPPEPEVQCHLCGRWLRDRRCLRRHISRHKDGTVTYKCDHCDEVKTTRAALYSHIRYHHTNTRHVCTLCGKEFKIPRNLKEHMATHTGIDLYACPFCPRTFKSYANMHNHKKKMHFNDWVPKYSLPSTAVPQPTLATETTAAAAAPPAANETPSLPTLLANDLV